jgi:hypothetical protein
MLTSSKSWRVKSCNSNAPCCSEESLKRRKKLKHTKENVASNIRMSHLIWVYTLLIYVHYMQRICAFSISTNVAHTSFRMGAASGGGGSSSSSSSSPFHRCVPTVVHHRLQLQQPHKLYATTNSNDEETASTDTEHDDIPRPTEAGGYTHTSASKAKISAANKGKTPWNKGKTRSEEVKQRIAEGVRRKNRERFLLKLQEMGITEEEYEAKKKEERRIKDAERRARRTENGGYKPTEETKAKISKVLKEKFAKGEIKKREYSGPFRKGFTHSEETRAKISESLKKKWAEVCDFVI